MSTIPLLWTKLDQRAIGDSFGHQMSKRPAATWCTQALQHGRGAVSLSEASQAATGAQASTGKSSDPLLYHMPTFPLSLLPSFQVSFPLLASLQSVAVKCRDESSLPTRAQGQRVDLASCLLCTHTDSRWGGHIHSPDGIKVSSVAHACSLVCPWGLPPRHSLCHPVCPSASTRICSWSQCRAPTRDPAMSTSRRV